MSRRRVRKLILLSYLYKCLCFVLLIINLIYVTLIYLRFSVDSRIAPFTPLIQEFPKFTLCFNLESLISKKVPKSLFDKNRPLTVKMSSAKLFSSTPKEHEIVKKCSYREIIHDVIVSSNNSAECANIFWINKFRMQNYMCYKLQLKFHDKFSFYAVTHSLIDSRFLYSITINEPLNLGHIIFPVMHLEDTPIDDRIFTNEYVPSLELNESFMVTYSVFHVSRLLPPYETKCGKQSKSTCYFKCMNQYYKRVGLTATYGIVYDRPSIYRLRKEDKLDENLVKSYSKLHSNSHLKCINYCKSESCQKQIVKTLLSQTYESNEKMIFQIETSKFPIMKLEYVPKFILTDYLTQCFSLACIWIEFSIFPILNFNCNTLNRQSIYVKIGKLKKLTNKLRNFICSLRTIVENIHSTETTISSGKSNVVSIKYKNRGKVTLKIFYLIFNLVVLALFSYQLYVVVTNYTSYETLLKFSYDLDPKLDEYPNMGVCFWIKDLFKNELSETVEELNYHKMLLERNKNTENYTLGDLLEKSIENEILFRCRFRNWTDLYWQNTLHSSQECRSLFQITKFYYNGKICYMFSPRLPLEEHFVRSDLRVFPTNPGVIYSIILNSYVSLYAKHWLLVHFGDDIPYFSIDYAIRINHKNRTNFISYRIRTVTQLPPPYDTKCHPKINMAQCKIKCYDESIKHINRIPYTYITNKTLPIKILSYYDLLNETVANYWNHLCVKCTELCQQELCNYTIIQTFASEKIIRQGFDPEYILTASTWPTSLVDVIPKTTLYDLYYQFFCCVSFWFGFSFFAINPSELYTNHKCKLMINNLRRQINFLKQFFKINQNSKQSEQVITFSSILKDKLFSFKYLRLKVIFKSIIALVCLVGCIFHIILSSKPYFSYPTVIETTNVLESKTDYSLSVCIDAAEIVARHLNVSKSSFNENSQQLLLSNVTISEIFNFSPSKDELIRRCAFWRLAKDQNAPKYRSVVTDKIFFHHTNVTICHLLFNISKILIRGRMCYQFYPKNPTKWNRDQMFSSLTDPKHIFMIGFPTNLLTKYYSVLISEGYDFPYLSTIFMPRLVKKDSNIWSVASYIRFDVLFLLPPYSDQGFTQLYLARCIDVCTQNYFEKFNVSLYGNFEEPYSPSKLDNMKMITLKDRKKDIFNSIILETERTCNEYCSRTNIMPGKSELLYSFTVTEITPPVDTKKNFDPNYKVSEYYVQISENPVLITTFKATITLTDLIINIGSVISIWFGLSAISINPFAYLKSQLVQSKTTFSYIEENVKKFQSIFSSTVVK